LPIKQRKKIIMGFKIKNFYQKTSPLSNKNDKILNQDPLGLDQKSKSVNNPFGLDLTHSGNPIPKGTVFYGEGEGSIPMELTEAEKTSKEIEELLSFEPPSDGWKPSFPGFNTNNDEINLLDPNPSGKLPLKPTGIMPEGNQNEYIESVIDPKVDATGVNKLRESMKNLKDPSKVKWSEAPPLGSQERTQWYIDNNLKLDKTTPPLAGADPEPIEEVMTSSVPKARNNRRTRRAERIRERNEKAEVRRFANSAKEGIADGSFAFDDDEFQDPTVA